MRIAFVIGLFVNLIFPILCHPTSSPIKIGNINFENEECNTNSKSTSYHKEENNSRGIGIFFGTKGDGIEKTQITISGNLFSDGSGIRLTAPPIIPQLLSTGQRLSSSLGNIFFHPPRRESEKRELIYNELNTEREPQNRWQKIKERINLNVTDHLLKGGNHLMSQISKVLNPQKEQKLELFNPEDIANSDMEENFVMVVEQKEEK